MICQQGLGVGLGWSRWASAGHGGPRLVTVGLGWSRWASAGCRWALGHKDVQTAGKSSRQLQDQPQVLLSKSWG